MARKGGKRVRGAGEREGYHERGGENEAKGEELRGSVPRIRQARQHLVCRGSSLSLFLPSCPSCPFASRWDSACTPLKLADKRSRCRVGFPCARRVGSIWAGGGSSREVRRGSGVVEVRCSWCRVAGVGGSRMRRWSSGAIDHLAPHLQLAPPRRTPNAPHVASTVWLVPAAALPRPHRSRSTA